MPVPPTKAGLDLFFKSLNLKVGPTRLIEALIYCRGPKMELSEDEFKISKLIQWVANNIRTLNHIDESKVDPAWVAEKKRIQHCNMK